MVFRPPWGDALCIFEGLAMKKELLSASVKQLTGKIQERIGKLIGSKEQQSEGLRKQVIGRADMRHGDARLSGR